MDFKSDKFQDFLASVYMYSPASGTPRDEPLLMGFIDWDQELFHATGEITGESYTVKFADLDFELDVFYTLSIVDPLKV